MLQWMQAVRERVRWLVGGRSRGSGAGGAACSSAACSSAVPGLACL